MIKNRERTRVLLLRAANMPHAGYGFPKGKRDAEETPAEAALRETWEETGIRLSPRDLRESSRVTVQKFESRHTYYIVHVDEAGVLLRLPAKEVGDCRWFDIAEVTCGELYTVGVERTKLARAVVKVFGNRKARDILGLP